MKSVLKKFSPRTSNLTETVDLAADFLRRNPVEAVASFVPTTGLKARAEILETSMIPVHPATLMERKHVSPKRVQSRKCTAFPMGDVLTGRVGPCVRYAEDDHSELQDIPHWSE